MKLVYQYLEIFFIVSHTSSHLHPLQVENCDSNSRLVVDEDDIGKFRLERVKVVTVSLPITPTSSGYNITYILYSLNRNIYVCRSTVFNPLTAGAAYIRVFIFY